MATPEHELSREDGNAFQDGSVDILMVTHDRPAYTRLALERLLSTCDDTMRLWLWHNGEHEETLEVVGSFLKHPRVEAFHHCPENTGRKGLWQPTNWLLSQASGGLVSKVDDDCLVSEDWADVLRRVHGDVPELGVVGCWRFRPEDFRPTLAYAKIAEYPGGHRILRNCWVEGSGFMMKRACLASVGLIPPRMGFPTYCVQLAMAGWIHGWYYPFLYQEHMGDPRSPYWSLESSTESTHSAGRNGPLPDQHVRRIRARALFVQRASLDPRRYAGWRAQVRKGLSAALSLVSAGPASGAAGW